MEDAIATMSKGLGSFCSHLQTGVDALKQSIDRHPISLDLASSTFIPCLNRRVPIAGTDLTLLDSMSFESVIRRVVRALHRGSYCMVNELRFS